uniref:Malate synthase N-terminal domain-containing protein n=1 Tax=Guillardia theta TaxID=55529 RepID=A0A7S4KK02_GUITH|mmetsp:Transcript_26179/g.86103  ORF Transcript_26179/g.86103 Transcript_26179/m.86103 type:complete len:232 (+) Transcript_26179:2-697(+)
MIGLKKTIRLAKTARSTLSCGMLSLASRNHGRAHLVHVDAARFLASVAKGGLKVDEQLVDFVKEICPGTGIESESFWSSFGKMVRENHSRNKELLDKRSAIQSKIDEFHEGRSPIEFERYKKFLVDIGYLVPEKEPFSISTDCVDPEIALVAGPQLVCPVDNPRFILNAANARWGSLLDAFYGTDVIPEDGGAHRGREYNPTRGKKVFEEVFRWMDDIFPLAVAVSPCLFC